jgi:hypothetical protein
MKIELKRITVNERLSEETNCFVADLYIDGHKIGLASNRGDGEQTTYHPDHAYGRKIIQKAEQYCINLPPEQAEFNGEQLAFKMNLPNYIDSLVSRFMAIKILKALNRKIKRETGDGIQYGKQDPDFKLLNFRRPFDEITSFKIWKEELVANISSTIKATNDKGNKVIITLLPEDMCKAAGLDPYKTTPRRNQSPRRTL